MLCVNREGSDWKTDGFVTKWKKTSYENVFISQYKARYYTAVKNLTGQRSSRTRRLSSAQCPVTQ